MKTSRAVVILFTLVAFAVTLGTIEASAQKKKPAAPAAPAAEQQKPTAPPQAGKGGATLKEVLGHYKGMVTTIGRLKAVEGDFIVIDDDGTEIMYPFTAIHSIKVLKLDEENPDESAPRIDIKLQ